MIVRMNCLIVFWEYIHETSSFGILVEIQGEPATNSMMGTILSPPEKSFCCTSVLLGAEMI